MVCRREPIGFGHFLCSHATGRIGQRSSRKSRRGVRQYIGSRSRRNAIQSTALERSDVLDERKKKRVGAGRYALCFGKLTGKSNAECLGTGGRRPARSAFPTCPLIFGFALGTVRKLGAGVGSTQMDGFGVEKKNRRGTTGLLAGTEVAVGWAFRAESVALEHQVSEWLLSKKSNRKYRHWFQTHYANGSLRNANFAISSIDDWAQKWAPAFGPYDAPLVLAVAYRESRFKRTVVSPAGAVGLMQLMPRTGKKFVPNGTDLYHPEGNLRAGIHYLQYLDEFWANRKVPHPDRLHFVLASYNTGPAPVLRAYKRAKSQKLDPARWSGNVELILRSPGRRYAQDIAELSELYRAYWNLRTLRKDPTE